MMSSIKYYLAYQVVRWDVRVNLLDALHHLLGQVEDGVLVWLHRPIELMRRLGQMIGW